MVKAVPGTLVKCDPSIKALILSIDLANGHEFVIEDLGDEEHLLIKNDKIAKLKHTVQQEIAKRIETRKGDDDDE